MPKRVDHDDRRRDLIDALVRCVEGRGSTDVTLREVAAEAGVSIGRVQHYFAGKDELLRAAALEDGRRAARRADEAVRRLGPESTERHRTRAALLALLPLDGVRRAGALIRRAVPPISSAAGAGGRPAAGDAGDVLRCRLHAAGAAGELRPDADAEREATHLAVLVSGMGEAILDAALSPARAAGQIDYVLDRTFQAVEPASPPHGLRPDRPGPTAMRIMRAAEHHFATTGIDGASLRDILRDAGQSNAGAVQYHFGSRRGLVAAVIARHRRDEAVHRHGILDDYERAGSTGVRGLAEALVLPLAAKLDDADGGREYLRINAEYFVKVSREEQMRHAIGDTSIPRWHVLLDGVTDAETLADPVRRWEPRLLAVRLALIQSAVLASAAPDTHDQAAVSYLVDVVTAVLTTPRSPRTVALADGAVEGWEDGAAAD